MNLGIVRHTQDFDRLFKVDPTRRARSSCASSRTARCCSPLSRRAHTWPRARSHRSWPWPKWKNPRSGERGFLRRL